ncbi:MAG: hypothetical protein ACP5I4_07965 [Oceanipulchritudo sp.]
MKHTSYLTRIALLAALGAFAAGCKPSGEQTEVTSAKAIDKQLEAVQKEGADAATDLSAYSYAQKQEFVADMEAQLAAMESSIDELTASITKASVAVQTEASPKLAAIRAKQESLEKQLDVIRDADASTWDLVKQTTSQTYEDLKSSFNDMRQWLGDKVAP